MVLVGIVIMLDFVMERKRTNYHIMSILGRIIIHHPDGCQTPPNICQDIGENMTKRSILRGNYPLDVEAPKTGKKSDQEAFEEEALKRLGGSTAIIMKGRKLVHEP